MSIELYSNKGKFLGPLSTNTGYTHMLQVANQVGGNAIKMFLQNGVYDDTAELLKDVEALAKNNSIEGSVRKTFVGLRNMLQKAGRGGVTTAA
jgi:hypothetical protein